MSVYYSYKPFQGFAQAINYGEDEYGDEVYSCAIGDAQCTPTETNTGTETPGTPNTGFFGMSQEAALTAASGGILLIIALVAGIIFAVRSSKRKNNTNGR